MSAKDCENPAHERALRLAAEADFTAHKLRGLAWLISGWLEFNVHSSVGGKAHDQVGLFLRWTPDALADGLDACRPPEAPAPDPNSAGLHVVRPGPVT